MTHQLVSIIILLILVSGCSKEFNKKDITETNEYGDLIGNIDNSDWQLHSYNSAPNILKKSLELSGRSFILEYDTFQTSYKLRVGIENGAFQINSSPPIFIMRAFQNPVKKGGRVNFRMSCDKQILGSYFCAAKKSDKSAMIAGESIWGSQTNYIEPAFLTTSDVDNSDFTLYYMFATTDSCVYWGKGDVIVD